jgi:hypothetical protein
LFAGASTTVSTAIILPESTIWLLYSFPLLLIGWFCARNWRDKNWQFATLLLAGFLAEVIHLAAGE